MLFVWFVVNLLNSFESSVISSLSDCPAEAFFLAAVSGGADSMSMLAALGALVHKEKLICMHIEHGIRPAEESCGDADFVNDFCKANEIECIVKHIPPGKIAETAKRKGIGIEAAARFYRHRALSKEAKRIAQDNSASGSASRACVFILLAHTKDDLLETAFMRILRGAGPAGLAAMPQKRGKIMRPLLAMTRAEVIDYLKAKNVSWREDSTNNDTQFLRNRIRHKLVPLLNEAFPSWKNGIASLAETQSLTAEFIKNEAEQRIIWEKDGLSLFTNEVNFFAQPKIIREESIFIGINLLSSFLSVLRASVSLCEVFSDKTIRRAVVRQFCEGKTNAADLGSVRLKRENGKIFIIKAQKEFFERGISRLVL